jgi:general secretion pathway protein J
MRRARAGFTLVELLVALAIFAILSAFAYRSLGTLLDSRAALERESRKWRDVALFVARIERDVQASLNRRATGPSGTQQAPISCVLDLGGSTAAGMALTRSGSMLQANALAAPQRVAYRLVDTRVERLSWAGMDIAPRAEAAATPVLEGVRALTFRFMDPRGEWRPQWGLPGSGDLLPAAVEVTLELASGERIVRLMDLPR